MVTSITVTFASCTDAGITINGSFMLSNILGTAPGNFSASVSINLSITASGFAGENFSGSFSISVSTTTTTPTTTTITLTGTNISRQIGTDAELLRSFTFTAVIDSTNNETDTVAFNYASTKIGGSVTVSTSVAFQTSSTSSFPHTGTLIIVGAPAMMGANNSTIRVTVLGDETLVGTQVTIELDANGSGTFGSPVNYSWTQLTS
jgi:hypothetical protein